MKLSDLSPDEKQFNDESNLLDDLYEFHPELFTELTESEQEILKEYYLIESDLDVDDFFAYRAELIRTKPNIEHDARAIFKKIASWQ